MLVVVNWRAFDVDACGVEVVVCDCGGVVVVAVVEGPCRPLVTNDVENWAAVACGWVVVILALVVDLPGECVRLVFASRLRSAQTIPKQQLRLMYSCQDGRAV